MDILGGGTGGTAHPRRAVIYLQQLLSICTQYGADFDIKYNVKKSKIVIEAEETVNLP